MELKKQIDAKAEFRVDHRPHIRDGDRGWAN